MCELGVDPVVGRTEASSVPIEELGVNGMVPKGLNGLAGGHDGGEYWSEVVGESAE